MINQVGQISALGAVIEESFGMTGVVLMIDKSTL